MKKKNTEEGLKVVEHREAEKLQNDEDKEKKKIKKKITKKREKREEYKEEETNKELCNYYFFHNYYNYQYLHFFNSIIDNK